MVQELKDFEKNWVVDVKNKSAKHNTGLLISYDSTNDDGSLRLVYTNVMSWNKLAYAKFGDVEKVEAFRSELTRQFVEIYKHRMNNSISMTKMYNGRE